MSESIRTFNTGFVETVEQAYPISVLETLLCDRATGNNIIWADDEYEELGEGYLGHEQITISKITGTNSGVIKPRIAKEHERQSLRTKSRAEVFTPSWLCNQMNNCFDEEWFGRCDVFNIQKSQTWIPTQQVIDFPESDYPEGQCYGWQDYVNSLRMEITCGEAPFICSRYDTVTGNEIPVKSRIGFLDRKLRLVSEQVDSYEGWLAWALRALQSSYGYEYQGDNLVIARINVLETFMEHHVARWDKLPSNDVVDQVATIISWNVWQMDGLTYTVPFDKTLSAERACKNGGGDSLNLQLSLFEYNDIFADQEKRPTLCQFFDWTTNQAQTFFSLKGKGNKMKKFYAIVGNPPYQETKGGTKNIDIWPDFLKSAREMSVNTALIHPGRWIIPKKQMVKTHEMIINSGLVLFNYYPNASAVFPSTSIDGGVSETLFRDDYDGAIQYFNCGEYFGDYEEGKLFISNRFEEEAYRKVHELFHDAASIRHRIMGNIGSLGGAEFGYSKTKQISALTDAEDELTHPIRIWANSGYGKGTRFAWHYIDRQELDSIPEKLLSTRKVMLDKKGHAITMGKGNIINSVPQIVQKDAIASGDVLFVLPEHDEDYELNFIKSMFMTKTVRFLMSITQKDLYVRGFENIPDYTNFLPLLKGELLSDTFLYKKCNFSDELVQHIETYVTDKVDDGRTQNESRTEASEDE